MNLNLGDNTKQEIVFGLRVLDEVFGPVVDLKMLRYNAKRGSYDEAA